jgi:hypothetical protein
MDVAQLLGSNNYLFWGGREGYSSLLNTDMGMELENLARWGETLPFAAFVGGGFVGGRMLQHGHAKGLSRRPRARPRPQTATGQVQPNPNPNPRGKTPSFMRMAVAYNKRSGFKTTLLLEPKPQEPTKHQ